MKGDYDYDDLLDVFQEGNAQRWQDFIETEDLKTLWEEFEKKEWEHFLDETYADQ